MQSITHPMATVQATTPRRKIRTRFMLECLLAVLPLLAVNVYQTIQGGRERASLDAEFTTFSLTSEARESYRQFMVGVNDAVDSGSLAKAAVDSLRMARDQLLKAGEQQHLQAAAELAQSIGPMADALSQKATLDAMVPFKALITKASQEVEKLGVAQRDRLQAYMKESEQIQQRRAYVVDAVTLATVLVLVLMIRAAVGRVVRPVLAGVSTAKKVASGDLRDASTSANQDETGELINAQYSMVQSLRDIVTGVRTGAGSVAQASTQIAASVHELSERTVEQAGQLQEASHAVAGMSATVQQTADTSRAAEKLAGAASAVASRGRTLVDNVVKTMSTIQSSSRRIEDIIGVIDGIAFQTNILALNAAVEAARAQEHGRGFAVVAAEVRSLSQRTSQAAHEVKTLINESVSNVRSGGEQVTEAGNTITDVELQVRKVSDMIASIAASTQSQSSGIREIDVSIRKLEDLNQRNAAMVEQSSAAAQMLSEHAQHLHGAVAVFKVGDEAYAAA
jgi:methyl-accepting chemotaxis protein